MTAEQLSASDPAASVWVAASAGTGKTKVLTDRVLRLMLARTPPERILCLTFTKAAAAEMSNRVARNLAQWAVADDQALKAEITRLEGSDPEPATLEFARSLFAQVLDVPGGLKIQTIHAFCQALLGRFPLEAGVAPSFDLVDERGQTELLADAEAEMLNAARSGTAPGLDEAIALISGLVAQDEFQDVMKTLARARGRFDRALAAHGGAEGLVAALYQTLGFADAAEADPEAIIRAACQETAFDGAGLRHAMHAMMGSTATDKKHAAKMEVWLATPVERQRLWLDYASVYLTDKGVRRANLCSVTLVRKHPEIGESLDKEAERVLAVEHRCHLAEVGRATAALVRLGAEQLRLYERAKARRALLDYEDLILISGRLLADDGVAPWVLFKLDGGIDHILVDEAQDTNPDQWQVVEQIAAEFFAGESARSVERTLFAVGDAKQSIFSFQGADRETFIRSAAHFEASARAVEARFRRVPLATSFRSTRAVLATVDAVFAGADALDGVADAPLLHIPHRAGQAGEVELWAPEQTQPADDVPDWSLPIDQTLGESSPGRLARRIAETVHGWIDRKEILPARGRPIRAGDVMVLVRRRNGFVDALVKDLKKLGVPVAGADRMVLTSQLAVMDLIALGRFALLPDDDHMLAVVLKGPFLGLNDQALFELAHGRSASLWRTLGLRRDENAAFAAAHDFLSAVLGRADFLRPFEFFARVLGPEGGRGRLIGRLGREAADPVDEFMAQALAYEGRAVPSLEGFLHWIEVGEAQIKRDLDQGRDEVRILTVHGSKGLEAPIVFLPDTCQVPTKGDPLLWSEAGVPLWTVRAANRVGPLAVLEEARKLARLQEYRRLLYVALTRAEDRMIICGFEGERKRPEGNWYDLCAPAFEMAEVVTDHAGREIRRLADPQTAEPAERGHAAAAARTPVVAPAWLNQPAPAEPRPSRPLTPSQPLADEPAPASPLGSDGGKRFARGRLIHRLLQTLPDLPEAERAAAAHRWLAQKGQDVEPDAAQAIANETLAVLASSQFAALFGPGSRAEVPIAGRLGEAVVLGQVDRLVVTDDRVLIADYKTNRPPPLDVADVAPLYLRQMALYRAVLAQIYPGRTVDCALLWTDGPRLMPLPAELLDAQIGVT